VERMSPIQQYKNEIIFKLLKNELQKYNNDPEATQAKYNHIMILIERLLVSINK
jgi:hypothetical protein